MRTRLLPQLAPLDARASSASLADVTARRVGASLNGAVATMTSIGDHSATAFAELAKSGLLRVNAHDLTRDHVAADAGLTEAKLRSALVASPAALTNAVMGAFDDVRSHPIRAFTSAAAIGRELEIKHEEQGPSLTSARSPQ